MTKPNFCFLAGVAPLAGVDDDFLLFGLEYISRTFMVFETSFLYHYHGVFRNWCKIPSLMTDLFNQITFKITYETMPPVCLISQSLNLKILDLTLICEFLGPSPSVFSGKKSRIIAGDVTVRTYKIKIICADRLSVELSFDAYSKWHMPI